MLFYRSYYDLSPYCCYDLTNTRSIDNRKQGCILYMQDITDGEENARLGEKNSKPAERIQGQKTKGEREGEGGSGEKKSLSRQS